MIRQYLGSGLLLLMLLGSGTLVGCGQLARFGVGTTQISAISDDPARYSDIYVRGEVVNQLSLLGRGVYEVRDDSGTIWVVTSQGAPALNTTITVRGEAEPGVSIGGRNLGVTLREKERF